MSKPMHRLPFLFLLAAICLPAAVTIDVSSLPDAQLGMPYDYRVPVSGMEANDECAVTQGSLPQGVTLNPVTCTVSGLPSVAGNYIFTLAVRRAGTTQASRTITFRVKGDIRVAYPSSSGTVGQFLSVAVQLTYGTPPMTFAVVGGTMPPGMNLNPTSGLISGTPTMGGSYSPQIGVTDSMGLTGVGIASFSIQGLALNLLPDPTLPDAQVGRPWSVQFSASGGVPPYRYAAEQVPDGLTFTSGGLLSGILFRTGPMSVKVQVWDANNNTSGIRFCGWMVNPGTSVSPVGPALPEGRVGTAYAQTIAASGLGGGVTVGVTGTLPPGLTLAMSGGSSAQLSGTPTQQGLYPFAVRFTDSVGSVALISYTLRIWAQVYTPLKLETTTLPEATTGLPYTATLKASGGTPPYTFAASSMPSGLTLNPQTGVVSGTPATAGLLYLSLIVTDSAQDFVSASATLNIVASSLILSHTAIRDAWPYAWFPEFTIDCVNAVGVPRLEVISGSLPPGVIVKPSTGGCSFDVRGFASEAGTFTPRVRITDERGVTGTMDLTIRVRAYTLTLLPETTPDATANVSYNVALSATGGVAPYRYFWIDQMTMGCIRPLESGSLSGMCGDAATLTGRVGVEDAAGARGQRLYTVKVHAGGLGIGGSLPQMTLNQAYSSQLTGTGGTPPYRFRVLSGALPQGIQLSEQGLVSGTPTQVMDGRVEIGVTDAGQRGGNRFFDVKVVGPSLSLGPESLPDAESGKFYSVQFTATGGRPPYKFWLMESPLWHTDLPISTAGVLSGTVVTQTDIVYRGLIAVMDADGSSGSKWYSLRIRGTAGLQMAPETLPAGEVGATYSARLSVAGGSPPYTFKVISGVLPDGVSLLADGLVTGLPLKGGTFAATIQASEAGGRTVSRLYSIVISGGGLNIGPGALRQATAAQFYSEQFTVSGGQPPYSWQLASGSLPQGMAVTGQGLLSGTPHGAGNYPIRVRVNDGAGLFAERDYTLEVTTAGTLRIEPTTLPRGKVGVGFEYQLTCTGGQGPCQFVLAGGETGPGVGLSGGGLLQGTPQRMGESRFTVEARDQGGAVARRDYVLEAEGARMLPETWKAVSTGAAVQEQLSLDPVLSGATFRLAGGSLPQGVTLQPSGAVAGAAQTSGIWTVEVEAIWNGQRAASRIYRLEAAELVQLVEKTYRVGTGAPFRIGIEARGGRPPYTYSAVSVLPAGVQLDAAGWLTGKLAQAGAYTVTLKVTDSLGLADTGEVVVKADDNAVRITTTWLPGGRAGAPYEVRLQAAGGTPPYTWSSVSSTLPWGLTLSGDGVISGQTDWSGYVNLTVLVTDAEGWQATRLLVIELKSGLPQTGLFSIQPVELSFNAQAGEPAELPACIAAHSTEAQASVRARLQSGAPGWLSLTSSETATPGAICVKANTAGLAAGRYQETIVLTVAGANPPEVLVPVLLTVKDRATRQIEALPGTLRFTAKAGGGKMVERLRLFNSGLEEVAVNAPAGLPAWLDVKGGPWTLISGEGAAIEVEADPEGLSLGLYQTAVEFNGEGVKAKAAVELMIGAEGKKIEADRQAVRFDAWLGGGDPQPQSVTIFNSGLEKVDVVVSVAGGETATWAEIGQTGCGSGATALEPGKSCSIQVRARTEAMAEGIHNLMLRIGGGAVPVDLPVSLHMQRSDAPKWATGTNDTLLFVRIGAEAEHWRQVKLQGPASRRGKVSWVATGDGGGRWVKLEPAGIEADSAGKVELQLAVDWKQAPAEGLNRAEVRLSFADGSNETVHVVAVNPVPGGEAACSGGPYAVILQPQPDFREMRPGAIHVTAAVVRCDGKPAEGFDAYARIGDVSRKLMGDGQGRYSGLIEPASAADPAILEFRAWEPGAEGVARAAVTGKISESSGDEPLITEVMNGMGQPGPVAPDTWIRVKGRHLGPGQADAVETVESLNGVRAILGGAALLLRSASPEQVHAYVPAGLPAGGRATLLVETGGVRTAPFETAVVAFAPLLYAHEGTDIALGWCEATMAALSEAEPAPPGSAVHLYVSGFDVAQEAAVLIDEVERGSYRVAPLEGQKGFQELVFTLPETLENKASVKVRVRQGTLVSNIVQVPVRRPN